MLDLSIVIVSYNTRDLLRACLQAARASEGLTLSITVVDNHSVDGSADMVAAEFPSVDLVRNGTNRGFAAACNQGLSRTASRHVLLLNPDAVVGPATLASMARFLDTHADAGICGPRILRPDGTLGSCGRSEPTVKAELGQWRTLGRLLGVRPPTCESLLRDEPFRTDWVEGSCLMIKREAIDRIGPLDERFFLFAEEMDWCHSARAAGWYVYALPGESVMHHVGQSTKQSEHESLSYLVQTRLIYFQKRRGVAIAALVGAIAGAGFLKQLAEGDPRARAKLRGLGRWLGVSKPPSSGLSVER